MVRRIRTHLGYYETIEEADEAYRKAAEMMRGPYER